jgi:hypothetical protein
MPGGTFNLKDILGSNIRLDGTLSVSGTSTLGGAATLKDSLSVAGGAHFAADTNTSYVYVGGTLSVSGLTTIGGHLIPSTNDTFDIGSPEFKIRDLYISDNSLWIGDATNGSVGDARKSSSERRSERREEWTRRRKERIRRGVDALSPFEDEEARATPDMFDASEFAARREGERARKARPRATVRTEYGDVMDR